MEVPNKDNQNIDQANEEESDEEGVDESVRKAFRDFDQDGDGTISIAELRCVLGPGGALADMCGSLNNDEIDALISIADKDGDGEVSFDEFVELVNRMKGGDSEEDMRKAFRFFDIDKDGKISKNDMKEAMKKLGRQLTDEDINSIFDDADADKNGMINYEEFVKNVSRKG